MNKLVTSIFIIVITLMMIIGATGLYACSTYFSGKIAVKGNMPHIYLVIITKNGEYKIVGKYKKLLQDEYQGKFVKVKGKIVKKMIGPGFPAEIEVCEIEAH